MIRAFLTLSSPNWRVGPCGCEKIPSLSNAPLLDAMRSLLLMWVNQRLEFHGLVANHIAFFAGRSLNGGAEFMDHKSAIFRNSMP